VTDSDFLNNIAGELREFANEAYGEHRLVRLRAATLLQYAEALEKIARPAMKKWIVETRVTLTRQYRVEAENQKEAEQESIGAEPEHEEEVNEETLSIIEVEPEA
jgi:hypothetical protein